MSTQSPEAIPLHDAALQLACVHLISRIKQLGKVHHRPVVVALDGGSGAGKSIIATMISAEVESALIPLDDFFAADIPDAQWPRFSVAEKLQKVFHWQLLREEVVEPLRAGQPVQWFPFDFMSGLRPDGTYGLLPDPVRQEPKPFILLDGAYSAGPALGDLVDFSVLVDTPVGERHQRLSAREDKAFLARWHQLWDALETYYFSTVRPPASFDYVVENVQPVEIDN